jgi:hypothetical protein
MHDTIIKLKDGRVYSGPVGEVRYSEGWIKLWGLTDAELATIDDPEGRLFFRDMLGCDTPDERIGVNKIGNDDILARARRNGWDGT